VEQRTPSDIVGLVRDQGVEVIDFRFCDLPGLMQHFSVPSHELSEEAFEDGYGFDGSSIRGFQEIQESDMLLIPDPNTAVIDPFRPHKTLNINCFVRDPVTGESYSRDPRYVAKKAEDYLRGTGLADTAYFGPEAEFYIFDSVRFDQTQNSSYHYIDSIEGVWNSGADEEGGNKGYKPRYKEGYFPVPPMDHYQDLRSEMVRQLEACGIDIEVQHHEVGTAGQAEIDMRFDSMLRMADKVMLYKYVVKNVALAAGKTVTFMPKPIFQDNGSGMHVHQSLWKAGEPLFFDETGYAGLSDMARWYIGGLLKHTPAILAFAAPTTNSYKRLVPGYEAPVNLVYSQRNRSACVRIPLYSKSPKAKRLEYRCPDPSANPYLAFSAMLMAGLDGIQNRIEPPKPLDKDLYDLPPEELAQVPQVPGSLDAVLDALEGDHKFLLTGEVFTQDVIDTWIDFKRTRELDEVRLRPHPWEFYLYYDI
jgi:glutamine synthetase